MANGYEFKEGENKNIVICCDGTWNSPEQTDEGKVSPTNVSRLHDAVLDVLNEPLSVDPPTAQVKWYDQGVGAGLSYWGKALNLIGGFLGSRAPGGGTSLGKLGVFVEGAMGLGISQNIREAYTFLCKHYRPGDRIFLFGFSRGAYTVRSLSGLIYHVGLLKSEYVSDVNAKYDEYKQWTESRKEDEGKNAETDVKKRFKEEEISDVSRIHDREKLRIHFLGVWDTVAALGIPMWGWSFEVFRIKTSYHDTTLVPIIDNAYHALAMDEMRSSFMPVLLRPPTVQVSKVNFEQVWFRGAHVDIGGGYNRHGLSDIAFKWMLDKAIACKLRVKPELLTELAPDPLALLHDEIAKGPAYKAAGVWPRMFPVPDVDPDQQRFGLLHKSVSERANKILKLSARDSLKRLPQTQGWDWISSSDTAITAESGSINVDPHEVFDPRERRWQILSVNDSARVEIRADQMWCPTGIILEKNRSYQLTAKGQWTDLGEASGPEGRTTLQGYLLGIKVAWETPLSKFLGLLRLISLIRAIFFSPKGFAWWAKRFPAANWMELIGMVNHATDWERRTLGFPHLIWYLVFDDPPNLYRRQFRIGKRRTFQPETTGPLYCFANDLWVTYGNNGGSVTLTVSRLPNDTASPEEKPWYLKPAAILTSWMAGIKNSDYVWGVLTWIPVLPSVLCALAFVLLLVGAALYYFLMPVVSGLWHVIGSILTTLSLVSKSLGLS